MENNKIIKFMNEHLLGLMSKMADFRFARATMAAGLASIPFTIVGSMMLVLNVIPMAFPQLQGIWNASFVYSTPLYMTTNYASMGALALYFNIVLDYKYTKIIATGEKLNMIPMSGASSSMFAFFMILPELVVKDSTVEVTSKAVKDGAGTVDGFSVASPGLNRLGTAGILVGITMAVLAIKLYQLAVKHSQVIRMPPQVLTGVVNAFTALIPVFLIDFVVAIIEGLSVFVGTDIFNVIALPLNFVTSLTSTWLGILVIAFLVHLLWVVGIHGANIIGAFYTPIALANFAVNYKGAHYVLAGEFMNIFVITGGSGATLGIVIWMAFRAHSAQLKVLSRTAIVSTFFNINEPIVFGCPVAYNPILMFPFILTPMITATTSYRAIKLGLVGKVTAQIPWPSPLGINAFIGTGGDWKAAILAVISVFLASLVRYPFMKIYDNKLLTWERASQTDEQEQA